MSEEFKKSSEILKEIEREIASVVFLSSDGHILMGKKDPNKGGVYPDLWHIPGGGLEQKSDGSLESNKEAVVRETLEETGLRIEPDKLKEIPSGEGESKKTLPNGEKVLVKMNFNRFEYRSDLSADELTPKLIPGDDLVELKFFSPEELQSVEQVPGGKELFEQMGYLSET